MKIISKFKDYYDYYQGIYGMDTILSFDRRHKTEFVKEPGFPNDEMDTWKFAICNKLYIIYMYKEKSYSTWREMNSLNVILKKDGKSLVYDGLGREEYGYRWWKYSNKMRLYNKDTNLVLPTNENLKHRQPILVKHSSYAPTWNPNVNLKGFGFAGIIPADKMFQDVSAFMGWLVDNPPLHDNQTNDGKIIGHGFDVKHSFRNTK